MVRRAQNARRRFGAALLRAAGEAMPEARADVRLEFFLDPDPEKIGTYHFSLKQQMLRSLLENNRRILHLQRATDPLPVRLAEARTEENIFNNNELQTVQGSPV